MNESDGDRPLQRYTLSDDEAPSEGVFTVVAALENCSPLELTPLAQATEPDALDALLAGDSGTNEVTFEYCGYEVTATPEEIHVRDSADSGSASAASRPAAHEQRAAGPALEMRCSEIVIDSPRLTTYDPQDAE